MTFLMQGQEIEGPGEGFLCMKSAWPSTIRTIFGDQDRFETTYFAPFKVCSPATQPLSKPYTGLRLYVNDMLGCVKFAPV